MKWKFKKFILNKGYWGLYWRLLALCTIGLTIYLNKYSYMTKFEVYGGSLLSFIIILIISYIIRGIVIRLINIVRRIKTRLNYKRSDEKSVDGQPPKLILTDRAKKKDINDISSKVKYITRDALIKKMFNQPSTKSNLGNMYLTKGDRPEGAFIILDKDEIDRRRKMIEDNVFTRNSNDRYLANVVGFKEHSSYVTVNGEKEYLYHRTHLLPFRFSLSEGNNVDNLLITGTTRMNNGDRPNHNYFVPSNTYFELNKYSRELEELKKVGYFNDGYDVYENLKHLNPNYNQKYLHPNIKRVKNDSLYCQLDSLPCRVKRLGNLANMYEGPHYETDYHVPHCADFMLLYPLLTEDTANHLLNKDDYPFLSLNDFEIFSDNYISRVNKYGIVNNDDKHDTYTYGTICNYDNSNIPSSVDAYLINNMTKRTILAVRFYNEP